ncbi:hypothetical protein Poly30_54520 [Planctomycetes bacterium Poly30]|uniref:Lactonase, 7-bladed beta-propeller n=1 Tax=Saltatorellus ferox TaxID=2528018 RepID=A0A518F0N0_9BACT|nr:hypothetical protein Poly30_54520 [Planctomycetes bacterium Poly30]
MLPALLLATLAQATTFLPFEGPEADDAVAALAFDATGDTLLIAHRVSRSLTRYDVQAGLITARIDLGPDVADFSGAWTVEWIPGTRDALVLDSPRGILFRVDSRTMTTLGQVSIGTQGSSEVQLAVTSDGATCAFVRQSAMERRLLIVDLGSMTVSRSIEIGVPLGMGSNGSMASITADDRRAVVVAADPTSISEATLVGYSLATGALEVVAAQAVSTTNMVDVKQSGDRSTWLVTQRNQSGAVEAVRVVGSDLASTNSFTFSGFGSELESFEVDPTGARGWGLLDASVFAFPLDQPQVTPMSSGVQRFPSENVSLFRVSGDGTRLLLAVDRDRVSVFDGGGALIAANVGSSFKWGFTITPLAEAVAPVFAALGSLRYDQVTVLDGRVPAAPVVETSFNSSSLDSFEGPYGLKQLGDSTEVAVVASSSSKLRVIDVATGASRTAPNLLANATDIDALSGGTLLVGHRDGTLLALDSASLAEVSRWTLGGIIEQVTAEPSGTRAWVRVGGSPNHPYDAALMLVETAGPQAGVLGSVPLAGSAIPPRAYIGPHGGLYTGPGGPESYLGFQYRNESASVVFDFAAGRAYAFSPFQEAIETIDLPSFSRVAVQPTSVNGITGHFYPQLTLSPGGGHLISSFTDLSRLFRVSASGLVLVAEMDCSPGAIPVKYSQGFSNDGSIAYLSDLGDDLTGSPCASIAAIDVVSGQVLDAISGTGYLGLIASGDDVALLRSDGVDLTRFDGANFSAPEPVMETEFMAPVLFDASTGILVAAEGSSWTDKGLRAADLFDGQVLAACGGGVPNTTGVQAQLDVTGSPFAGEEIVLTTSKLAPFEMLGVLMMGDALNQPMPGASGLGQFCVGGNLRRVLTPITPADGTGRRRYALSTDTLATSTGTVTVVPGETWVFQEWHRDSTATGLPTSNTSTALAITWR